MLLLWLFLGSLAGGLTTSVQPIFLQQAFAAAAENKPFARSACGANATKGVCLDALKAVGQWDSYTGGVSTAIGLLLSPWAGAAADRIGTKPMLIISSFIALPSTALIYVAVKLSGNMAIIYSYYVASALSANWYLPLLLGAFANFCSKENRVSGFAMVMATVDVTLIMGPPVGGFIETSFGSQALYLVSLVLVSCQCVIAFFLPSSMWRSGHALAGEKATAKSPLLGGSEGIVQVKSASGKAWGDITFISKFAQALAILNRSNFFRILAAIAFLQSFVSSGVTILYIYAMRSGFHFTMDDENLFLTIAFTASAFSQFVLVKPMGKCLGMLGLLVLGLTSGILNSLLNGIVLSLLDGGLLSQSTSKLFVYIIAGSISSFTFFAFPAIGALKAEQCGRRRAKFYSGCPLCCKIGSRRHFSHDLRFALVKLCAETRHLVLYLCWR